MISALGMGHTMTYTVALILITNVYALGRPETVVKCISMIYDILDKVPPKGSEQRYDPNCFDQTYDYGGKEFRSFVQSTRNPRTQ